MTDSLTAIERIGIQLACERLVHAYCRALDQGDMDAAADLFAADGSFARPTAPDAIIAGQEAIRASLRARPSTLRTRHLSTNVIIEVDGPDAAHGVSYLTMVSTTPAEGAAPPHESRGPIWFGEMRDRFVRENGEWRFLERRGSVQIRHVFP
jgi:hypothetical protein